MEIPAIIKDHPYAWGGAAVALLLLYLYAGQSSAAPTQTAVVSSGIDPTQAALTAQQMQDNAAITVASLQAQTQTDGLTALQNITQSNNAAAVQESSINANVVNAQTAASIFGTATTGLLDAASLAGTSNGASTLGAASGNYVIGNGNQWLDPSQAIADGFQPHSGQNVPVYTPYTVNNPATDVTANNISELFNNVIRAGQGTAPMQTVTLQPSQSTGYEQTGTAHVDPVFAVWDGTSATPTITDITLNGQSQYGYTGSVFNPATMTTATNITPNAVPAATAAQLPALTIPNFGNFGNFGI